MCCWACCWGRAVVLLMPGRLRVMPMPGRPHHACPSFRLLLCLSSLASCPPDLPQVRPPARRPPALPGLCQRAGRGVCGLAVPWRRAAQVRMRALACVCGGWAGLQGEAGARADGCVGWLCISSKRPSAPAPSPSQLRHRHWLRLLRYVRQVGEDRRGCSSQADHSAHPRFR